ncbi:hypothetical protein DFH28DRAFT_972025 [Melampsora americana]|nr:hypothetical protein DFH28DRAFT_972025 [Melampsora americana]
MTPKLQRTIVNLTSLSRWKSRFETSKFDQGLSTSVLKPRFPGSRWLSLPSTSTSGSDHQDTGRRPAVRIMEVSPRDGLQNEPNILPVNLKAKLIRDLVDLGLRHIEVGSFVSPKWVPQMTSTAEILDHPDVVSSKSRSNPTFSVLMPNRRGFDAFKVASCLESPDREHVVNEIALFASATEGFSQANLNSSVSESIEKMRPVAEEARRLGLTIRGYVSCVFGCPYEGNVDYRQVASVARALFDLGCYEVAISDTIGVAVPSQVIDCLNHLVKSGIDPARLGIHCHDTFGTSLANILTAVSLGVKTVDSSIGGIGGCPYSPGATGNVATEDVVYALESSGYSTGILNGPISGHTVLGNDPALLKKLEPLADAGNWINSKLGRSNSSRVGQAVLARRARRTEQKS